MCMWPSIRKYSPPASSSLTPTNIHSLIPSPSYALAGTEHETTPPPTHTCMHTHIPPLPLIHPNITCIHSSLNPLQLCSASGKVPMNLKFRMGTEEDIYKRVGSVTSCIKSRFSMPDFSTSPSCLLDSRLQFVSPKTTTSFPWAVGASTTSTALGRVLLFEVGSQ